MKLVVDNISKTIQHKQILKNVSMVLESGHVYGFVGSNGSGKTMLFRAVSGLMKVDSGSVSVDGKLLYRDFSILPKLGITMENVGLFPNMTGFQNLEYLAGLNRMIGEKEIRKALQRVGLDPDDKRIYRKYSLGMRQRLAVAQAIMEKPDILMLDEPTNGLDEDGVLLIRKVIMEEKDRGACVMITSHNKEDIIATTDHLFRVESGMVTEIGGNAR